MKILTENFLIYLENIGLTERTFYCYKSDLNTLNNFLESKKIYYKEINDLKIFKNYETWLLKKYSKATINRKFVLLIKFIKFLIKRKIISDDAIIE